MFDPESYEQLRQLLSGAGLVHSPAELHGTICGVMAGDAQPELGRWSTGLLGEAQDSTGLADLQHAIERLQNETLDQIDRQDFGLELLLPDDDALPTERSGALRDWCQGFLYGFGLSGRTSIADLSAEVREALRDFGEIARLNAAEVGAEESDQRALMELEEYIRVAALLIRTETAGRHGDPAEERSHDQ